MEFNEKHTDLIIRFLTNEISESENTELDNWKKLEAKNQEYFDDYKILWELTENKIEDEIFQINIDEELDLVRSKLGFNKAKVVKIKSKKSNFWKFAVASAAILVLSVSLFFIFNKNQVSLVAENSVIETTLPDNSEISLNVNSEIKYPKNFEKNRMVELVGDAFFQVEHDSVHPFIVKTENYYVEVVGTEFYVSTKDDFEVTVKNGVVKVYPINNSSDSIVLRAGDNVVETTSNQILSTVDNQNYLAWKTGKIEFNNTPLSEITSVLEKTYNISIEISNDDYKNLKMTATFDNQSIESILKVVEATMNVKISKQGEKIIIY